MTMHLLGPAYTTTNTKKRKKFKSAEEKRQYLEYQAWKKQLKSSLSPAETRPNRLKVDYSFVRETAHIPSHQDDGTNIAARKEARVYNGERRLIGIATLHKSNMQPVFDEDYAKEVARMRRG